MNMRQLISKVVKRYGIKNMAVAMGQNESTFKNKVHIHSNTHHVYAEELEEIAEIANTDEIAKYFAEQRNLICIRKQNFEGFSDSAILDLFLSLQKEQGDWSEVIKKSLSDGELTWDELQQIKKEYDEFIGATAEIMSRLESYMAVTEERKQLKRKRGIEKCTNIKLANTNLG